MPRRPQAYAGCPGRRRGAGCPSVCAGTFSQIYFLEALEHFSEADGHRVLHELRRVSRTGARCLITTPNYRSGWVILERLMDWMRLTPPMANGQHLCRPTAAH